jgi:hypothetical protein
MPIHSFQYKYYGSEGVADFVAADSKGFSQSAFFDDKCDAWSLARDIRFRILYADSFTSFVVLWVYFHVENSDRV